MQVRSVFTTIVLLVAAVIATNVSRADIVSIPLNNFESGLGSWTPSGNAQTGLYIHTVQLQPTDDTTTNFAAGGSQAASIGKSTGVLTSSVVDLSGGGASESLTIDLGFVWHNGSTTRRAFIDFSPDGGTTWFQMARMQTGSGGVVNKVASTGSVTITEGIAGAVTSGAINNGTLSATLYNGTAFGSNSVIRIRNLASAGADARLFIDNLAATSTIEIAGIPEPSSLALLGLGGILFGTGRRRRS